MDLLVLSNGDLGMFVFYTAYPAAYEVVKWTVLVFLSIVMLHANLTREDTWHL